MEREIDFRIIIYNTLMQVIYIGNTPKKSYNYGRLIKYESKYKRAVVKEVKKFIKKNKKKFSFNLMIESKSVNNLFKDVNYWKKG